MAGRIARGDIRLYQFAPPDKNRPAVVLTRDSAIAYLSTVTVAPITTTIRGVPSEVVLSEEDGTLRSEFAQRGYRFPAAIGEACRSARFRPYAPNLRCIALLPRLRRQPTIESAQFDAPVAGELLFHPRFLRIPRLATILRRAIWWFFSSISLLPWPACSDLAVSVPSLRSRFSSNTNSCS